MKDLKSEITSKYSDIIMLLPDYELKNIIFFEWINYFDITNGFKVVNSILENKGLPKITEKKFIEELKFLKHVVGRLFVDNVFNFENSFKLLHDRKWEHFYVFVDIHSTILYPDYGGLAKKYYPHAKHMLQKLSKDKRIKLALYTCSHPHEVKEYLELFEKDGIHFEFINKNPEVANTRGGYFEDKPYMNVLLDDKAGFVAEWDWYLIDWVLNKHIEYTLTTND